MQATINPASIEDTQISQAFLEEQVCQLLNWSADDFNQFFYETAIAYLENYFGNDGEAISKLSRRKEFWKWFRNHWTYRDQVFYESFLLDDCAQDFKLELYHRLHSATVLACDIYPSSTVLGPDFTIIKMQLSSC
jgi:hypothetical protein